MTTLPNTIIWDFNGTLLDDIDAIIGANNEINRRYGMGEISADYYRQFFAYPPMAFYEGMGYDFTKIPYAEASAEFIACYQKRLESSRLTEGAREVLQTFHDRGIEQIVLSAHNQQMLTDHLEQLGIAHYFSHISGDDGIVITGKVERARKLAAERDLSQAVLIGDTSHDFETACALGCRCVLYSGGHEALSRLEQLGVPIFGSMAQIKEHILK